MGHTASCLDPTPPRGRDQRLAMAARATLGVRCRSSGVADDSTPVVRAAAVSEPRDGLASPRRRSHRAEGRETRAAHSSECPSLDGCPHRRRSQRQAARFRDGEYEYVLAYRFEYDRSAMISHQALGVLDLEQADWLATALRAHLGEHARQRGDRSGLDKDTHRGRPPE